METQVYRSCNLSDEGVSWGRSKMV